MLEGEIASLLFLRISEALPFLAFYQGFVLLSWMFGGLEMRKKEFVGWNHFWGQRLDGYIYTHTHILCILSFRNTEKEYKKEHHHLRPNFFLIYNTYNTCVRIYKRFRRKISIYKHIHSIFCRTEDSISKSGRQVNPPNNWDVSRGAPIWKLFPADGPQLRKNATHKRFSPIFISNFAREMLIGGNER